MSREMNVREEKKLEPGEVSWNERKEHVAEHPPTGAPKKGSLLKDLADEALSKGRPVLVIPLDVADPQTAQPDAEDDEQPPEMRLPKNTTVIFAGNEGFPVIPESVGEGTGDPAEQLRARMVPGSANHVIYSDPRSDKAVGGELSKHHQLIFASPGRGKAYSQGARIAEKKQLGPGEVKYLEKGEETGEGSCEP